jgi:hydrogenase maturation factor
MRVDGIDEPLGIAFCVAKSGNRAEVMIALVNDVAIGDWLLVHAGTALTRLDVNAGAPR